jgi:hypothetical protein
MCAAIHRFITKISCKLEFMQQVWVLCITQNGNAASHTIQQLLKIQNKKFTAKIFCLPVKIIYLNYAKSNYY